MFNKKVLILMIEYRTLLAVAFLGASAVVMAASHGRYECDDCIGPNYDVYQGEVNAFIRAVVNSQSNLPWMQGDSVVICTNDRCVRFEFRSTT